MRIAEAWKEGNMKKYYELQRLLVASFAARALAVKIVTSNKGGNTPGVDKVLWDSDEKKMLAIEQLKGATPSKYRSSPLRRIMIPKAGKSELRPLGIPTIFDRAVQQLYTFALTPFSELTADPHSFGYRAGLGTWDALATLRNWLWRIPKARLVYEADIKGFFDNISHKWMLDNVPLDQTILSQFFKAGYRYQGKFYHTDAGVPQGGIISAMLANIALNGLQKLLYDTLVARGMAGWLANLVTLVRYADDFVILLPWKSSMRYVWSRILQRVVINFLDVRSLTLHPTKSMLSNLQEGDTVTFLGVVFSQELNKVTGKWSILLTPCPKKVDLFIEKLRAIFDNMEISPGNLIVRLNFILIGWSNYYRYCNSKATFLKVNQIIWEMYFRWLKKKYKGTTTRELIQLHFTKDLTPSGTATDKNGGREEVMLFQLKNVKITSGPVARRGSKHFK